MILDSCSMIKQPRTVLVYIYAVGGAGGYRDKALHFVASYERNPPLMAHDTLIVCNGVPANDDTASIFDKLPNVSFLDRDDSGWDIGGYQEAARTVACDMMIFCGGHTYFRKPGWLARMWEVYREHGLALYGSTGNQGDLRFNVHPHIRTTGFWCKSALMAAYPHQVTQGGGGGQRYEMEHGATCLSNWARSVGLQRLVVGWNHVMTLENCNSMPNGYNAGDQSNVLIGDRMTMSPYHHCP